MNKFNRTYVALAIDASLAATSVVIALFLRVGFDIPRYPVDFLARHMFAFALVFVGVSLWTQVFRSSWRYVSINDLKNLSVTCFLATLVYMPLTQMMSATMKLPKSHIVLNAIVALVLTGGIRLVYRYLAEHLENFKLPIANNPKKRVLIYGLNKWTESYAQHHSGKKATDIEILGILVKDASQVGRHIHGVPVIGILDHLQHFMDKIYDDSFKPEAVVVTDPDLKGPVMRRLFRTVESAGLELLKLETALISDSHETEKTERLAPVAIEDLLGREQVTLDRTGLHHLIAGKTVMITGAGGSIGSELVRQIAAEKPSKVILVDQCEFFLYTIDQELNEKFGDIPVVARIADVSDGTAIQQIISGYKPDIVFHAAAKKHVPMSEHNPEEAVNSNVLGTMNVADACARNKVATMVFISTDKAINPTNVMGATKRLAESYCQALDIETGVQTKFVTVRFGNVLGSMGSVIPRFQEQINSGGPITITDPNMERYFMSIKEAVELVLQAAVMRTVNDSGERGRILVLDMGESVKIIDLAKHMVRLSGLELNKDIDIKIIGKRPGEKLYEELFYDTENMQKT
ncbi:MAG: polysaccharide biosynthesis protein, partial [Alphaproteobacteria bacterium]